MFVSFNTFLVPTFCGPTWAPSAACRAYSHQDSLFHAAGNVYALKETDVKHMSQQVRARWSESRRASMAVLEPQNVHDKLSTLFEIPEIQPKPQI